MESAQRGRSHSSHAGSRHRTSWLGTGCVGRGSEGQRAVPRSRARPFGSDIDRAAALYAQNRLDVSEPTVWAAWPDFTLAILALRTGGWDVISKDWRLARICLQVMAEQGPGMAFASAEADEDAQLRQSLKALGI